MGPKGGREGGEQGGAGSVGSGVPGKGRGLQPQGPRGPACPEHRGLQPGL